jgi:N-acetylmuramic acid 6-phosphate etherase
MIDMMLTNEKLRERALRILAEASGKKLSAAEHALQAAGHDMRVALVMLKLGVGAREARTKLESVRGDLRAAMGE